MTGFGRAKVQQNTFSITVEMKSVNHRFLETTVRLPRHLMIFEERVRKLIASNVRRGRVEVSISVEGEGLLERKLRVDWELLEQYKEMMHLAGEKFNLPTSVTIQQLLAMPEVTAIEEAEKIDKGFEESLYKAVTSAVSQMKGMRDKEGTQLKDDLLKRLEIIEHCVHSIAPLTSVIVQKYRERLEAKLKELGRVEMDDQRLLTEITLFADRCDIHEELVRLQSHIGQFRETLESEDSIGRKLDFIVQEMHREMNTIGSKANDGTVSKYVVEMKNNLEKIREQVQNIE